MPGSCEPNGTHEWSVPPIMLKPSDPWFFGKTTSCKLRKKKEINFFLCFTEEKCQQSEIENTKDRLSKGKTIS